MACVQTASAMIDGMGNTFSMVYIEPALAKWSTTLPTSIQRIWIQPEIYSEMGYHVAETYHPMVKYEDFPEMETALEFEKRIAAFVDEASDTTDKTIVFVAHSAVVSLIRNHKLSSAEEAANNRFIPLDTVCIDIATVSENPLMQFTRINNAMRRLASNEAGMTGAGQA
ncbi:hypothetical protein WR25_11001 [Diploscapter pachys]|uniref:Uncharacterized protein n=1 Tax=Diploscapter pachys TaxID=2018661 RepID=A0A2A2LRF0_9BILA|nr:hypothetical protein WR25_11001 [Diploscapter pachys]